MFGVYHRPWWVVGQVMPRQQGPHDLHGATWVYEGSITQMCGPEGLYFHVCDSITYIIVSRNEEAALLLVEGIGYG